MERQTKGMSPGTETGVRTKTQTWLRVARLFIWGVVFASFSGGMLMEMRFPDSPWAFGFYISISIVMIVGFLRKDEPLSRAQFRWLALWLCLMPVFFLRTHIWAPVAAGALFAVFDWANLRATGRPYPLLPIGALLAGVLSLLVPWPNEQRFLLTFVGVGIVACLQGAWVILRHLQGHPLAETAELPLFAKGPNDDRWLVRAIHWIVGPIGHVQISSPELEQRIRTKFQPEIDQLTELDFDLMFFYGETFSIFRALFLLQAIYLIDSWLKKVPITLHDGTKVLIGNPVFISKDKTSYAYPNMMGVTFDTAFLDGTILASKNYGDKSGHGPTIMFNHCPKASISDTWTAHLQRLELLEASGKRVDPLISFQAYAEISYKETAPW